MGRYSELATKKRTKKNCKKWIDASKKFHGDKFYYDLAEHTYVTQKHPEVTLLCSVHGQFNTTPHNHLRFDGGGCNICGLEIRGKRKRVSQFWAPPKCLPVSHSYADYLVTNGDKKTMNNPEIKQLTM